MFRRQIARNQAIEITGDFILSKHPLLSTSGDGRQIRFEAIFLFGRQKSLKNFLWGA
jgi:hypothetical protein